MSRSSDTRQVFKLAPSPRDVPSVIPSPKSFRSQSSRQSRQSSIRQNDIVSSPHSYTSQQLSSFSQQKLPLSRPRSLTRTQRSGIEDSHSPSRVSTTSPRSSTYQQVQAPESLSRKALSSGSVRESEKIEHRINSTTAKPPVSDRSSSVPTRNKRIVVVDPESGKKYPLHEDDHSLTNKELHVIHRGASCENASVSGNSLSTASALTEVTYGKFSRLRCLPNSCIGFSNYSATEPLDPSNGRNQRNSTMNEGRDDTEGVQKNRDITNSGANFRDSHSLPEFVSALGELVSPKRISSLAKSLFFEEVSIRGDGSVATGNEVRYKRIALVIFPHEIDHSKSLIGMDFNQCPDDFQAHVQRVSWGSRAEKIGVKKGDIVSFAVALSNMSNEDATNTILAEKLIKRLESVGMRTSYRELYDIFLSKTTNRRPIGIVLRRWRKPALATANNIVDGENEMGISDEFEWSTQFLQSLTIKCREVEFEQKIPLSQIEIKNNDGPALSFLPCPTTSAKSSNLDTPSSTLANSCTNTFPIYRCINLSPDHLEQQNHNENFLGNKVLCSLVEQSVGLIFIRRIKTMRGKNPYRESGFAVVRNEEGSWSIPSFVTILGSKNINKPSPDEIYFIVVRKKELINKLISGNTMKVIVDSRHRANVLIRDAAVIAVKDGWYYLMRDFAMAFRIHEAQNQTVYATSDKEVTAVSILTGKFFNGNLSKMALNSFLTATDSVTHYPLNSGTLSPPEQSNDFYGALRSLECPYAMHAHPVIPETIQPYCNTDWVESTLSFPGLTPGFNIGQEGGMKTLLRLVSRGTSIEDKREIDTFTRKFKYYMIDGVPVNLVIPSNNSYREEKVLRLLVKNSGGASDAFLELSRKRRPGFINVGVLGNYVAALENLTKLSRTPPDILGLEDDDRKRFFSFETDLSSSPVMMLAKSKKDAMLLLCGLKLLLERAKIVSY